MIPVQVDDDDILDALRADVRAAWPQVTVIHTSPPTLPAKATDLPRVFLTRAEAEFNGAGSAMSTVGAVYSYDITLQRPLPANGTIDDAKRTDANALLARLTAQPRYQGHQWRLTPPSVRFRLPEIEEGASYHPFYMVTVVFTVTKQQAIR